MVMAKPLPHPHHLQAQHQSEERAIEVKEEVCKERVWMGGGRSQKDLSSKRPPGTGLMPSRSHLQAKSSSCPKAGWPSSGSQAVLLSSETLA